MLNPFFLQGSKGEQGLIQDLVNEQIKMYGVDVYYIPRKYVLQNTVIREVIESKFDTAFPIEAYVSSYDGYSGQGTLLSKFGIQESDDLTLVISREKFELYITPLIKNLQDIEISDRPKEGDLIFFPLGERIFEIKYIEHESPFYQLQKNYVYELRCELFRYENEIIDTSIEEIDTQVEDEGYITTVEFIGAGTSARASAIMGQGYIDKIYIDNDGYGYITPPSVIIDPPQNGGIPAKAIAITTSKNNTNSITEIVLTFAGINYTKPPKIEIVGSTGSGAIATCSIGFGTAVVGYNMLEFGSGYIQETATVTVEDPPSDNPVGFVTAIGIASVRDGRVYSINVSNPGLGYTQLSPGPGVTISLPSESIGFGTYIYNEIVTGSVSGVKARVKSWDSKAFKLNLSPISSDTNNILFYSGESIVGSTSLASYVVKYYDTRDTNDKYSDNKNIENEAFQILDFTEQNPFGNY
jgi:hypothetical protein